MKTLSNTIARSLGVAALCLASLPAAAAPAQNLERSGVSQDVLADVANFLGGAQGKYIDIHCWVFTPWSFLELMGKVVSGFGVNFELGHFLTTQDHDLEFYVQLVKTETSTTDWNAASAEAFKAALWPASAMPTLPADGLYRRVR